MGCFRRVPAPRSDGAGRRRHRRSCGRAAPKLGRHGSVRSSAGGRCAACRSIARGMGARCLPTLQPRAPTPCAMHRALRAGVPAERHGDHPAHELLLAARLACALAPEYRDDQSGADDNRRHAVDEHGHRRLGEGLAVPIPPPGPPRRQRGTAPQHAAAIEVAAGAARDSAARVRNDASPGNLHTEGAVEDDGASLAMSLAHGKILKPRHEPPRVHLRGAFIQDPFKSRTSDCVQRCGERFGADMTPDPRRAFMQFTKVLVTKVLGSPPLARCWRSQLRPSAPMRCRSAIPPPPPPPPPAPPRRFRRTPDWRPRKCIGGIVTITGGIAGTIIIATTITVTGTAGNCDSLAQRSHRARFIAGLFLVFAAALKLARLLRVFDGLDQREESVMKSLIGAAFVAGARSWLPGQPRSVTRRRGATGEGAERRHIRRHRFQRAPL